MSKFVLAFVAVIGCVLSKERYAYKGESWKKELDLSDLVKMDMSRAWDDWMAYFKKTYKSTEEETYRFGIFEQNVRKIAEWNTNKKNSARLRPNRFADMTKEEFSEYVNPKKSKAPRKHKGAQYTIGTQGKASSGAVTTTTDPASVDWSAQGYVSPVEDQTRGTLCWAFSVTGAVECNYAIAHGQLTALSEQQLIDCAGLNGRCDLTEVNDAYTYVIQNGGLCSDDSYPYTGRAGTCKEKSCTPIDPIKNYTDVTARDESALEHAVAQGCVSVAVEADQFAFQYYSTGVLTSPCGTNLDLDLLVVGYGTDDGEEYWKAKNSWGVDWGEDGYILICKDCQMNGDQGECGINDIPTYPIV